MPFAVRNVETDLTAYQELIARGFRTMPVTIVGDEPSPVAIRGFDERAISQALRLDA